ncbi:MAG: hypothetical protein KGM15_02010 [Pseudomonadota bacterium]|nr:hypothetical protein [Pseudomonadota bacterium]
MRQTIRAISALAAMLLLAMVAQARAQVPPSTVSDYANAMNAQAASLDAQISDRQRRGDMAAAQRLVLVAAMVRRAGEEFRAAEQENLTDDIAVLPAPVPARIKAALEMATNAVALAADHPDFVARAHQAANALISAVPAKVAHPVIYGLLSRDLAEPGAALPSDIVFYGYRLFDPIFKTVPAVLYGRTELEPASVAVADDRIDVTLPEEIRKAVKFAPDACDQRPSFSLRVRDTYAQRRGIWPIVWHYEVLTNTDFNVLQSPVFYAAKIVASAEAIQRTSTTASFREKSSLTVADCESTRSAEAVFSLPEGAKDVVCAASWVDASNTVKLASRCTVKDGAVEATGQITAGPKSCSPDKLCACSTPAQGWLAVSGSYAIEHETSSMRVSTGAPALTFPSGGVAEGRIATAADEKLRHVALEISRRACAAVVDTLDLAIGEEPDGRAQGVSKTGAFRASIKGGALRVGAADAVAEAGKAP